MHVIDFIKQNGIQKLQEAPLNIEVRDYPDRVVLNYSMIDSPKIDPVVVECRALILSKSDWRVLSRAFDRFFNIDEYPEKHTLLRKMAGFICLSKIDGSLISVYNDGTKWCASSRSMAFAEGLTANGRSFFQVFEEALKDTVENRFKDFNKDYTYVFELVSPETRVVTPYSTVDCFLLTVRNKETGAEFTWEQTLDLAQRTNFKTPQVFHLDSVENIIAAAKELPAMQEGYVCLFWMGDRYERIKIKNPAYLAISNMRANGVVSNRRIALLVIMNDHEEYLGYFPEDRPLFEPYVKALAKCKAMAEDLAAKYMQIQDQKEFAMLVKDTPVGGLMFAMRKQKIDFAKALEKATENAKVDLLEKFTEKK